MHVPMPKRRKDEMARRAEQHELVARLLRSQRVMRALDELHDSQAARDEMEANPKAFIRRRNIRLRTGVDVAFRQSSPTFSIDMRIGNWRFGFNETTVLQREGRLNSRKKEWARDVPAHGALYLFKP
jgi:hypothetical protein